MIELLTHHSLIASEPAGRALLSDVTAPFMSSGNLAMLAGIITITAILLIRTRRQIRESRNRPESYTRELQQRLREERSAVNDVQDVMEQLEQLAKHIHGQIDTRYAKLEASIRSADQRIEKLSRLVRVAREAGVLDLMVDDEEASASGRGEQGNDEQGDGGGVGKGGASATARGDNGLHADVHRLAEAGMEPVRISRELQKPIGEVELILALRRSASSTRPPATDTDPGLSDGSARAVARARGTVIPDQQRAAEADPAGKVDNPGDGDTLNSQDASRSDTPAAASRDS